MSDNDRWALHNAAAVLRNLQRLMDEDEELATKLHYRLATPGGETIRKFWLAASAASGRNLPDMLKTAA